MIPSHFERGIIDLELPNELQVAINNKVSSSASKMKTTVEELSYRYRHGLTVNKGKFLRSSEDIAAYVIYRMPATFAAVFAGLQQVKDRYPEWCPSTVLDAGAGPGTVMWAASEIWPDDTHRFTLLEREKGMITLGRQLASYSLNPHVQKAEWHNVNIQGKWESNDHELVVASYVLGEMKPEQAVYLVNKLWEKTTGILLLVEPGTPDGFSRIKQARDQLLAKGGYAVAPCPHGGPCPMAEEDWCHFAQRLSRSRLHRQSKAGSLAYEDEKFSYIAISKFLETRMSAIEGRVIRHPQIRKGHVHLDVCQTNGLEKVIITRRDRDNFLKARHLRWGSVWQVDTMDKQD